MLTRLRLLTLFLALTATGGGWLAAESSPEATEWLDRIQEVGAKSYEADFTARMNIEQQGQSMGMTIDGHTTHADRKHQRMDFALQMSMGGMKLQIDMLGVMDGEFYWLESDNPMAGGKQVVKMSVDESGEMAGGGMGVAGGGGIDPIGQIEQMKQMFDFELTDRSGGKVTLTAQMTDEVAAEFAEMMPDGEGVKRFVLIVDEQTAFPLEMRIGGEPPFMTMNFRDVQFVDRGSLDDALFRYTPPEGVAVTNAVGGP